MTPPDPFDVRLSHVPDEWRSPLVDVIDTAEAVHLALSRWGLEQSAEALVGLTQLVLQEHHRHQQEVQP